MAANLVRLRPEDVVSYSGKNNNTTKRNLVKLAPEDVVSAEIDPASALKYEMDSIPNALKYEKKYKNSSLEELQASLNNLNMEQFGLEQYGGTFQKNDEISWLKLKSAALAQEAVQKAKTSPDRFASKYAEHSFDAMQQAIIELQDLQGYELTHGGVTPETRDELLWLQNNLYTKPYATQADYKAAIASANKYLQEEEDLKEKAYNIVRGKAMGWYDNGKSPKDYEREAEAKKEFYEEKKGQISAMESALKAIALDDYTAEINAQPDFEKYAKNTGKNAPKVKPTMDKAEKVYTILFSSDDLLRQFAKSVDINDSEVYSKYEKMTSDERNAFLYLWNKEGKKAAKKYLERLDSKLNKKYTIEEAIPNAEEFARKYWLLAQGGVLLASLIDGKGAFEDLGNAIMGKEIDIYSPAHMAANVSAQMKYTLGEMVGDWEILGGIFQKEISGTPLGTILYNAGTSMSEMGIGMAFGKGFGLGMKGTKVLTQFLMSSGAATDQIINAKQRGLEDTQAVLLGVASGATEWLTEKISLDTFLADPKAALAYIVKNTAAEGGEEALADVLNTAADWLVAGKQSEFRQIMQEQIEKGATEKQAFQYALSDLLMQIGSDALTGALAGLGMSGIGIAGDRIGQRTQQSNNIPQNGIDVDVQSGYTDAIGGGADGRQELLYYRGGQAGEQNADTQGRVGAVQEAAGGMESDLPQTGSGNGTLGDRGDSGRVSLTPEQAERLQTTAVKNADGTPKPVYHFTGNMEFDTFAEGNTGFHFGSEAQAAQRGQALNQSGHMIEAYLDIQNPVRIDMDIMNWQPDALALKLYGDGIISQDEVNNVFSLARKSGLGYNSPAAVELRRILAEKGYDGVVYQNGFEGEGESYIAFYPEQIITLDDGRGTGGSTGNAVRTAQRSIGADIISEERVGQARGDTQYTEAQYNDFGWARANGVLSDTAFRLLTEKIAEIKTGTQFARTRYGDYIIPVGDESGIYNILVYTDGDMESPHIRKIIEINAEDRQLLNDIRSAIYDAEESNEAGGRQNAYEYVKRVYGEEYIVAYARQDFPSFRRYAGEGQRGAGRAGDRADGTGIDRGTDAGGAGPGRQVNGQGEADSDGPAFSMPENRRSSPEDYIYRKTLEQGREALRGVPEQSGNSAPAPDGLTVLKETVARKAYEQAQKDVSGLDKQPEMEDNGNRFDLVESAEQLPIDEDLKPQHLMHELMESGVRFNINDIILVAKKADGTILWLEKGNNNAGLNHILARHQADFLNKSIDDVPRLIVDLLKTEPIKTGSNMKGFFADYSMNGNKYRIAYGTNGFIVSIFPIE